MGSYPQLLHIHTPGNIARPSDFGADLLIKQIAAEIAPPDLENVSVSPANIRDTLEQWILGFETDPESLQEKQSMLQYAQKRPSFVSVLEDLAVTPLQYEEERPDWDRRSLDKFGIWAAQERRFETYAKSVTLLRESLETSPLPPLLQLVLDQCKEAEATIQEARSHLNPDLEVRIEGNVQLLSGFLADNLLPVGRRINGDLLFAVYNRDSGFIVKGTRNRFFEQWNSEEKYVLDHFTAGFEDALLDAFATARGLRPPIGKTYDIQVHAIQSEDYVMKGQFTFRHKDKRLRGPFRFTYQAHGDTTAVQIRDASRYLHNKEILDSLEPSIQGFEELTLELKAIAAATRFLQRVQENGYPLSTPSPNPEHVAHKITTMYHPVLVMLEPKGTVIPNDVLAYDHEVTIITGANRNGKTCYKDAIGLSQVMFQAALPIVASESELKIMRDVLTHYVEPGNIETRESRFSYECARVRELLDEVTQYSLFLCDEIGTGTDPRDGEQLADLVEDTLRATGATGYFTTHYHELAQRTVGRPQTRHRCCRLDHTTSPPGFTYILEPGISDDSEGLVIAAQYGLSRKEFGKLLAEKASRGEIPRSE